MANKVKAEFDANGRLQARLDVDAKGVVVFIPLMESPKQTSTGKSLMVAKTAGQEPMGISINGATCYHNAQVYCR